MSVTHVPKIPVLLVLLGSYLMESQQPVFVDVADKAGVAAVVRSGTDEKKYLMEGLTGGVCLFDYNDDGYLDLYVVNGSNLGDYRSRSRSYPNRLYRNNGDETFTDVTQEAGSGGGTEGWGMGCCAADFNNDGSQDLYVTNLGPNVLYRNNGDGTFSDVAAASGTDYPGCSTGCAWGDFDADGSPDLYVANYVDFDVENLPLPGSGPYCRYLDMDVACGPRGLPAEPDRFFRNNGDGTFSDTTEAAGLKGPAYYGFGVCVTDYDNDADSDIFVANDSTPNFLFQNQGNGTFKEVGLLAGVAFNEDGRAQACMGVDFGDYDNDGFSDLLVTNFSRDTNTFFHNEGNGSFLDVTTRVGMSDSYLFMGWGMGFIDYQNDGLKDIFVVNGHLYPQVDSARNETEPGYRQQDLLYENLGNGRFSNTSSILEYGRHVGRGAALGDLNNDGRVDVVISNLDGRPNVVMNHHDSDNNWILVRCVGTKSGRDALGARVLVVTERNTQFGEVRSGCSYLSSGDPRVHFGLGKARQIKELRIQWPSGRISSLREVKINQIIQVEEPTDD